jgi:electron transport complex protein RnfB
VESLLIPVSLLGGIGLLFGLGLAIAAKKLSVAVDPKIEKILGILPGANCAACGYPGCSGYAKAVAQGTADTSACVPGGAKVAHAIADILGISATSKDSVMAVVHCKGGKKEAKERAIYNGIADCFAATLAGNGTKTCPDGCLGLGSCVRACPFDALSINSNGVAVVDPEKCTGCGKCVSACPRKLIELIPKVHKIYLACNNHDRGAKVKQYCEVGCTACTLCVKTTPSGAITMENNIPRLDYAKNDNFIPAAFKCPQKCFVDLARKRPKVNIDPACNGCGECVSVCPVNAISGETSHRHVVDKEKCIGCGICLDKCPIHAISLWGGLGYSNQEEVTRRVRR